MGDSKRKMIIDGKVIDIDKAPLEELERLQRNLEKREQEIREKIEKELENY